MPPEPLTRISVIVPSPTNERQYDAFRSLVNTLEDLGGGGVYAAPVSDAGVDGVWLAEERGRERRRQVFLSLDVLVGRDHPGYPDLTDYLSTVAGVFQDAFGQPPWVTVHEVGLVRPAARKRL